MIDIREGSAEAGNITVFCELCEMKYSVPVECAADLKGGQGRRRYLKFVKIHDHGLSARMDAEDKENNELNLIAAQVFADNPQATTDEKMNILKARIELYREGRPVPEP